MVPNPANHCQFAACALLTAAMDLRLLPIHDSRSTRHAARRTTLIPSSPAGGIVPRIFAANLLRQVESISQPPNKFNGLVGRSAGGRSCGRVV